jgi:aryl-alcohol dehydrogenase-like predicted oxidoreductase
MEHRKLGKIDHMSSVLTFGGAALWSVPQAEADAAIEMAVEKGVNQFDVSPSYGLAETRLGPWMKKNRSTIFLACKTRARGKTRAWESIKRSLETLQTDYFDLYQFHGVDDLETLSVILGPGGALEAVLEARDQGLIKHIGITGHRPYVHVEALNRFNFDTVLFPLNRVIAARPDDFNDFEILLENAKKKDVGLIAMKAIAKRRWMVAMHAYKTWYEPFNRQEEIDSCFWYTLSRGASTMTMPSDISLWPMIFDAIGRLKVLDDKEQKEVVREVRRYEPIFHSGGL